jgi:integrase
MRSKRNSDGSKRELSALEIKSMKKPGLHAVGTVAGLCLKVDDAGNKSWVLRVMIGGRRRSMGLGGYPSITLAGACEKARKNRDLIEDGIDPIGIRQKAREGASTVTFGKAAELFIESKSAEWKSDKHTSQWRNTIKDYCADIKNKDVSQIETHHIRQLLEDIWNTKTETASRLRGRIEAILDWATVSKYRTGANPARWKGHLEVLLASPKKIQKVKHHKAMPWKEVPQFVKKLNALHGIGSRCLELVLLTACRTTEATNAKWSEFDLKKGTWTIPAERMKAGEAHVIALSSTAIALLTSFTPNGDYVFSAKGIKPISNMAMLTALKRMKAKDEVSYTVHGFRSTFRDWAAENTDYSNDVCESALAHATGGAVSLAYKRTKFLEQRYPLMEDWAAYLYKDVA